MSDYNFLMETRLSPEQFAVISLISRLAAEHGQSLYLVGGAVRDLTYGQQVVRDLDFVVEGSPFKILRALPATESLKPARGARAVIADAPLSLDHENFNEYFNSADLVFSSGVRAELSMCREEVYSRPGQAPDVHPAGIFEDLKRRDFAINAMAVSLHPNSRGLLLDPTNGAGDIERHEIRALQSRGFLDDPLRIYRLLRLGLRLDFKPDEKTQRWLDAAMAEGAWERLSVDQQARELGAILHEDQPGRILKLLSDKKLLGGLDKKLASVHLPYDRFTRIRNVLQSAPGADAFLLNFHGLVEKLGQDNAGRLAKRIIGDNKSIKLVLSFDQDAKKLERALGSSKAEQPSQVYALLSPQPQPLLLYLLANTKSAKVQNKIKNVLFRYPEIRSRLPRAELQALGVKAGPEFDQILAKIFDMQLDGKIKSHQQLIKDMRELAGIKEPPPAPPPPPAPARKGREKKVDAAAPAEKKGKEPAPLAPPAPASKGVQKEKSAPTPPADKRRPLVMKPLVKPAKGRATKAAVRNVPTSKHADKGGKKGKKR